MPDRYDEPTELERGHGVVAVAPVTGPNLARILRRAVPSHERPIALVVPAEGPPAAIAPNPVLGSWETAGFPLVTADGRRSPTTVPRELRVVG